MSAALPGLPDLLQQAVGLHEAGQLADAAELYQRILTQAPQHFDAQHLLGVVALQQGRLGQAQEFIGAALRMDSNHAAALNNLGTVHLRLGNPETARELFIRAIDAKPDFVGALTNLGTALRQLARSREAVDPLRRAHALERTSVFVCNLLGACLLDLGDARAAGELFEAATRLAPTDADAWGNWSVALGRMGEQAKARECAETAVALSPNSTAALAARAAVEFEEGRIDAAFETYREAIALDPGAVQTLGAFAHALSTSGYCDEALERLAEAVALDEGNARIRWQRAMCECRPYFDSADAMERARNAFAARLEELEAWFQGAPRRDAYTAVGSTQPFFLAYQPVDNRELLARYGRLCGEWMTTAPVDIPVKPSTGSRVGAREPPRVDGRIRLGIVSAHLREHSVWNAITKGWVRNLDASRFELWLFHLSREHDAETAFAERQADHFEAGPKSLQEWIDSICGAKLDALIYPEIGMDALTTQLAALRLVPVQAMSWGHPETSGLPTIDLYFSAELLEPPNAQQHYTEKLVTLPHVGVCVDALQPAALAPDLKSLGLPDDEPLLLCPGTPFKYSPIDDPVWARIAKGIRDGAGRTRFERLAARLRGQRRGRLVFFRSDNARMDRLLAARLRRAFEREEVDFDAHVCLLPRLERPRFFGLMQRSALLLDTLGFSGFNNAMQAVEAGLPVLAREGRFMRGRLASAIMRRMDLPELVAVSDDDFVGKAVQLASNVELRATLRLKIAERRKTLFNDVETVRALERCVAESVMQAERAAD